MVFGTLSFVFQRNGFISRDAMKQLLREIDDKLTEAELDAAIDEIDEDGSGKIEFEGLSPIIPLPSNSISDI